MNLNLRIIVRKVLSRWYLLLSLGILFMSFVFVAQTFFQEKVYRSTVELLILPQENSEVKTTNEASVRLNIQLMNTYMNVMKSTPVLSAVKEKTKVSDSIGDIRNNMVLVSDENSLGLTLKMNTNSPDKSQAIANQISKSTQEYLATLFPENKLVVLNPGNQGIRIQDRRSYLIAFVMGIWSGIAIIIFELLSQSVIRDNTELLDFGFPVIGAIPIEEKSKNKRKAQRRRKKNSRKRR